MTKTEILEAIKQLTTAEQLEVAETILRIIREEREQKELLKSERKQKLAKAAEAAIPDYMPGGSLYDLWSPDSEDYYESENEPLGEGVEANA